MALPIEDYAVLGDTSSAALVGRDGSVDWLCLPRFDSPACFAALLGDAQNGRWLIGPAGDHECSRRYMGNSVALETTYTTKTGTVRVVDIMPLGDNRADIVRRITGVEGVGLRDGEPARRCERMAGNFPQVFSHLTLVGAAVALATAETYTDVSRASNGSD